MRELPLPEKTLSSLTDDLPEVTTFTDACLAALCGSERVSTTIEIIQYTKRRRTPWQLCSETEMGQRVLRRRLKRQRDSLLGLLCGGLFSSSLFSGGLLGGSLLLGLLRGGSTRIARSAPVSSGPGKGERWKDRTHALAFAARSALA